MGWGGVRGGWGGGVEGRTNVFMACSLPLNALGLQTESVFTRS